MGLFKEMRNFQKQADAMTGGAKRPSLTGALRDANATMGDLQAQQQKAYRLNAEGIPGTGTIVAVRDTGMTINDNPELELDIAVSVGGRDPYQVTHRQVIARIAMAGFQPGAEVPLKVDPADASSVLIA
jgi:hypothetical protein